MKLNTVEEFSDLISYDISWRRKEIQTLLNYARVSKGREQIIALRANILMLYAHWEGFIKTATESFLIYIKTNKFIYSQLKDNFLAIKFYSLLKNCEESNRITFHHEAINMIRNECKERMNFDPNNVIKTDSNLSSTILKEILLTLGFEKNYYELKNHLIDTKLLKIRNEVAHGEETYIELKDYEFLYAEVFDILIDFKNRLENMVITKSFQLGK